MAGLVTWRVRSRYARERGVLCWRNGLGVRVAIPRILTRSLQRGWRDRVGFARAGGRTWSGPRASFDNDDFRDLGSANNELDQIQSHNWIRPVPRLTLKTWCVSSLVAAAPISYPLPLSPWWYISEWRPRG